jgi:phosphoglycerate kinase
MANTFFRAQGYPTGSGLVEESALEDATKVGQQGGKKLVLPVDLVCARKMEAGQPVEVVAPDAVKDGWMGLDIGPRSVAEFGKHIASASTIVWNGPMGVAEIPEFSEGTRAVGEAVANSGAYTLVGGGDTVAAIDSLGLSGFSHVSTGGGATLEYLEGKELPGVAILKDA